MMIVKVLGILLVSSLSSKKYLMQVGDGKLEDNGLDYSVVPRFNIGKGRSELINQ